MATQTACTVLTILQLISDLRGESSTNTDAGRIRLVSRAERDYALRMAWRTHLLRDQTTTGDGSSTSFTIGSASYPMRMKGLTEVFVGGTTEDKRHSIVDFNTFKILYNSDTSTKMVYEWYDAANDLWKMRINPTPANGDTITYSHYWEPPTRTLATDTVVCPKPELIARLALSYIYEGEDEEKYKEQQVLAEQLIQELTGMENSPAVGQTYSFGSVENPLGNRGIGSY